MIYGYKSDTESMTVIVAGNDKEEYEDFFKQMVLGHKYSESVEMLTTLEMMMDEEFTNISYPVIKVFHKSYDEQEKYIEEYAIKIVDRVRTNYLQEEMQKITTKKEVASNLTKEKLKSEMLGEVYVSPSIEEVYGLNIHDPWKKEETDKVNVDDSDVMSEASFGDADTQRRAREQARMDADPNYIPTTKFLGIAKTEEDDDGLSFDSVIQVKSKESKKLDGTFTDEEKQEELNQELDSQEKVVPTEEPSSGPVYQNTSETKKTLDEMQLDYDDSLEAAKKKNHSYRTSDSVKVSVNSLPDVIKNKISSVSTTKKLTSPDFIQEYWYSPASIIDGYCVLPQSKDKSIVAVHNMDITKTLTFNVEGIETKLIKKQDGGDSVILYMNTSTVDDKEHIEFFVIRIK